LPDTGLLLALPVSVRESAGETRRYVGGVSDQRGSPEGDERLAHLPQDPLIRLVSQGRRFALSDNGIAFFSLLRSSRGKVTLSLQPERNLMEPDW